MKAIVLAMALIFSNTSFTYAESDNFDPAVELGEESAEKGNDAKRAVKKGWNRTKEAVCMEGDLECAAKKTRNRVGEGKDTIKDKAKEAKNTLDADSKNN